MASFEAINYSVRPNKCVERKIIFESLSRLSLAFKFSDYHYVGMGSMWFVDFVMAHKYLAIKNLTSFELAEYHPRAEFNRPYKNINVIAGPAADGIAEFDWTKPAIVWLDYDSGADNPAIFDDSADLAARISFDSILMVTVNAHLGTIPKLDEHGKEVTKHESLRLMLKDAAPSKEEFPHINAKKFPSVLATCLIRHIERAHRRSGRGGKFVPFLNFKYTDNAPMITVGGMFVNEVSEGKLLNDPHFKDSEYFSEELYEISIPPLTHRERMALDALLPSEASLSQAEVKDVLGFTLRQDQLDGYSKFYKLYPTYGELTL